MIQHLRNIKPSLAFLALLFAAMIFHSTLAAEPPGNVWWYDITISTGKGTETFTGSSLLEPARLSASLGGAEPIELNNVRFWGVGPESSGGDSVKWRASNKKRVFLLPRTVLFFYELSADPVSKIN